MNDGIAVTTMRGAYRIRKEHRRRDVTYQSFSRAEDAARRLVTTGQGDAFIITQEVARVTPAPAGSFVMLEQGERPVTAPIAGLRAVTKKFGRRSNG